MKTSREKEREAGAERILGSSAFIEAVLKRAEERESAAIKLEREGWDFDRVLQRAAEVVGLSGSDLLVRGRSNARSQGRGLLCKWMVDDLQTLQAEVARKLGISNPSVSVLVKKGRQIENELGVKLNKSGLNY